MPNALRDEKRRANLVTMHRLRGLGTSLLFGVLASSTACAPSANDPGASDPPAAEAPVERGPTRARRESEREAAPRQHPAQAPTSAPLVRLTLSPADVSEGEDGAGNLVPAVDPVHLDLRREGGWSGRALDPVLTLGHLAFHQYSHVDLEVLRFVAADAAALPLGEDAFVQWGDDLSSRIFVSPALDPATTGGVSP
jgi:hypothetical protein